MRLRCVEHATIRTIKKVKKLELVKWMPSMKSQKEYNCRTYIMGNIFKKSHKLKDNILTIQPL